MSLAKRSNELKLKGLLTLQQAATAKGTSYDSLRMWLRLHPCVPVQRVGRSILVRLTDIESYRPRAKETVMA